MKSTSKFQIFMSKMAKNAVLQENHVDLGMIFNDSENYYTSL